ncbi:endonuclease, partial [Burkholderia multivorans]
MALIRHAAAPPEVVTAPAPPAAAPGGRDLRTRDVQHPTGGHGPWHARAVDRIAAVIDELDAD